MNQVTETGIRGEGILLRPVGRQDLPLLRNFVNDPEVMHFSNTYWPINEFQQEKWFEQMSQSKDSVWFAIVDVRSAQASVVGTCCLVAIDWLGRLAELRIRIGDKAAWGHGLGTEATRHLVHYGFTHLNLERIWLRVFASNQRALHLYEKVGFQVEGRLRRAVYLPGLVDDVILMGLLRDEWEEPSKGQVAT